MEEDWLPSCTGGGWLPGGVEVLAVDDDEVCATDVPPLQKTHY